MAFVTSAAAAIRPTVARAATSTAAVGRRDGAFVQPLRAAARIAAPRASLSMKSTEQQSVESLVAIVSETIEFNTKNGTADLGVMRRKISVLLAAETSRLGGVTDAFVGALRTMMTAPSLPAKSKTALAAVLSAVILTTGFAGGAMPAMAAGPAPAEMAQTETSASDARSMAADDTAASSPSLSNWRYSEFINAVEANKVDKVTFSADGQRALAVDSDGNRFKLDALPGDPDLLSTLTSHKVDVTVLPAEQESGAGEFLRSLIFPAVLFGGLFFLSRRAGGGGMGGPGGPMDLAKSGARVAMVPETGVTFKDVAGVDQAKLELQEVVQFLKESERFTDLGAKIPRGVILEGPPGTGKTLLARAVAGEAGVPFFSISGSEFVEMFVGVGASRVRDLFSNAKKNAPCIIFIDEIDAVGRQRGAGIAGGNDEREQTLNQMLTEMDGFEGNAGVIVIAATNRADVLDSALLRPGRFDRRVMVDLPDYSGRVSILKVHGRNKPLAADVDLDNVARRTPGFSGASLQNLLNEAAIFTARRKKTEIGAEEVDDALDRLTIGAEKKDPVMSVQRKELVAFHEAGHAVVGALTPGYDEVAKISITAPRWRRRPDLLCAQRGASRLGALQP
eukprot:TRINITY_DN1433_c0_g1_i6.p1 TRINITY_DN1433_c0_g1~~TRINITY_DN1433_c0_g1_i6.p1  ORF type:complete len:705 (-),score=230.81 TRINITY_DN1433_c0_g1_i6:323-2185(-)